MYPERHLCFFSAIFWRRVIVLPNLFLIFLLLHMLCYMPTVNLAAATAFHQINNKEKEFPLIRVFGTNRIDCCRHCCEQDFAGRQYRASDAGFRNWRHTDGLILLYAAQYTAVLGGEKNFPSRRAWN